MPLNLMASRRLYRPPSMADQMSTSSREPSPTPSCEADVDTDDEKTSQDSDYQGARPLSVHIPSGPYCVRRPTLSDIISNTAPPPYTLSAFMAYLSSNHCLETLEFTMDANRYRKHFYSHAPPGQPVPQPGTESCKYMKMLWQKLMDAYIVRNGPREVNLPCSVRDKLLKMSSYTTPPTPDSLDPAVNIVYDLMQESALMGFLSHCQSAATIQCSPWKLNDSDENVHIHGSLDERSLSRGSYRKSGHSPPMPPLDFISSSYSSSSGLSSQYRPAQSSPFSVSLGWHRHSTPVSKEWLTSHGAVEIANEDGTHSPTATHPMTPPGTPPHMMDASCSSTASPRHKLDKTSWKKMAGKMGLNKKDKRSYGMQNCAALQAYPSSGCPEISEKMIL